MTSRTTCDECGSPGLPIEGGGVLCGDCFREKSDAICSCDDPTITRTLAKGTPASMPFCECGGRIL